MILSRRRRTAAIAGCLSALGAATLLSRAPSYRAATPAPPAAAVLNADKGNFRIMVNGQQMGKEQFEINQDGANWTAHGVSEVQTPDGATRVSGTLHLHADGSPTHYEWSTEGKKKASATIDFSNLTANMELRLEGARPYNQTLTFSTSPIVILDNNLYHQYAILAGLYDREKKGSQTFAVLVPQSLTPGTITVDSLSLQESNGKKVEELVAKTEDLEVHLYLDNGRLIRIAAPSNNAEIVRE
jgi:hypothetical protein